MTSCTGTNVDFLIWRVCIPVIEESDFAWGKWKSESFGTGLFLYAYTKRAWIQETKFNKMLIGEPRWRRYRNSFYWLENFSVNLEIFQSKLFFKGNFLPSMSAFSFPWAGTWTWQSSRFDDTDKGHILGSGGARVWKAFGTQMSNPESPDYPHTSRLLPERNKLWLCLSHCILGSLCDNSLACTQTISISTTPPYVPEVRVTWTRIPNSHLLPGFQVLILDTVSVWSDPLLTIFPAPSSLPSRFVLDHSVSLRLHPNCELGISSPFSLLSPCPTAQPHPFYSHGYPKPLTQLLAYSMLS